MNKKPTTIRARILRGIILSVVVTAFILLSVSSVIITTYLVKDASDNNMTIAESNSRYIQSSLDKVSSELDLVSSNSVFYNQDKTTEERQKVLDTYVSNTECKDLCIANSDGSTWHGTDLSQRDYFISAMKGNCYISSPLLRLTDNKVATMVGAKVKYDGFDGVIFGLLKDSYLNNIVDDIKVGNTGYAYIIDKSGTIIAHPDENLVNTFVNPVELSITDKSYKGVAKFITDALAGENGTDYYNYNGEKLLATYYHIDCVEGWTLVIAQPTSDFLGQIVFLIGIMLVFSVVVSGLSVLVGNIVSKKIGGPIEYYTNRLQKFAEGDIYSETEIKYTNDELEILGKSLSSALKGLVDCIKDVSDVLSKLSNGDLVVSTQADYIGDLSEIKDSLDNIITNLVSVMTDITTSSNQVSSGADQVALGSQSLSQGSITQASTVEELSASVTEVAEKTVKNAEYSKDAKAETQKTVELINDGSQQMNSLMSAMGEIDAASSQIANIIKTIDDIAFQTNILALNAAVEAARAGTAGKGFAVVAEEVRNLAAKSAEAASTTASLIQTSIKTVNNGTGIAKRTEETLNEIVQKASSVLNLIGNISSFTEEQATQIEQIKDGIDQISDVVQTNSATAEESAAASEELSSQATMLTNLVEKFKLK